MAVSQRYISAPPWPTDGDSISQVFGMFYDHKGPNAGEWQKMTTEQRQAIRIQMEEIHERMMSSFRAMPSQLMLIFRYLDACFIENVLQLEKKKSSILLHQMHPLRAISLFIFYFLFI